LRSSAAGCFTLSDFVRVATNIVFESLPDVEDAFSYSEGGAVDYMATQLYKNSKKNELASTKDCMLFVILSVLSDFAVFFYIIFILLSL
jgi:hypothetical protein